MSDESTLRDAGCSFLCDFLFPDFNCLKKLFFLCIIHLGYFRYCYNKRIAKQRQWYEKNCKGKYTYTPYKDLKKEEQKIEMIATYKCYSPEQGSYEEKRDYSQTIKKIIARQHKFFGRVKWS